MVYLKQNSSGRAYRTVGVLTALFVAFCTFAILPYSNAEAAPSAFEKFAGTFKGSGTIRRSKDDKNESVRCRISSTVSPDGLTLSQSGSCAVPGQKVSIDSRLVLNPANNRVTGKWTDVVNGSAAGISGRMDGDKIRLTVVGKDPKTQESRTLWMELVSTASGYRMVTMAPDQKNGGKFVSGEIAFTK